MHYFIQLSPFLYIYAIWGDYSKRPHPQPLPVGEGSDYPCFLLGEGPLLEDGARRPQSYLDNSRLIHG